MWSFPKFLAETDWDVLHILGFERSKWWVFASKLGTYPYRAWKIGNHRDLDIKALGKSSCFIRRFQVGMVSMVGYKECVGNLIELDLVATSTRLKYWTYQQCGCWNKCHHPYPANVPWELWRVSSPAAIGGWKFHRKPCFRFMNLSWYLTLLTAHAAQLSAAYDEDVEPWWHWWRPPEPRGLLSRWYPAEISWFIIPNLL